MKIVTKQRWNEAIAAEDNGWDFHNEDMYMKHDFGAKHGQIVTYAKHMMLFEDFSTIMKNWFLIIRNQFLICSKK